MRTYRHIRKFQGEKGFSILAVEIVAVVVVIIIVGYVLLKKPAVAPTVSPTLSAAPTITVSPSVSTSKTPSPTTQARVYGNQYMTVTVPAGWAYATTANGAINITKNNYILFINPNASQASGVEGGRFAEIAMGAPSADAVVISQPSPPCGTAESTGIFTGGYYRLDLYVGAADKKDWCAIPTNNVTVWYFSYVNNGTGYINYYTNPPTGGLGIGYVITMAYNSKVVNDLPVKDSPALTEMLSEMTNIVKTLQLKKK